MIFMPKMLYFLIFPLASLDISMLNDFTVEPLKTSFAWWRDICYRFTAYVLDIFYTLQHVFKYSCVLFMFVLLLIYHAK